MKLREPAAHSVSQPPDHHLRSPRLTPRLETWLLPLLPPFASPPSLIESVGSERLRSVLESPYFFFSLTRDNGIFGTIHHVMFPGQIRASVQVFSLIMMAYLPSRVYLLCSEKLGSVCLYACRCMWCMCIAAILFVHIFGTCNSPASVFLSERIIGLYHCARLVSRRFYFN